MEVRAVLARLRLLKSLPAPFPTMVAPEAGVVSLLGVPAIV